MRHAARTDRTHAEIAKALRKCGWQVKDVSKYAGLGCDLFAAKPGRFVFVEIKDGQQIPSKRLLTPSERALMNLVIDAIGAGGRTNPDYAVLESAEQAARL